MRYRSCPVLSELLPPSSLISCAWHGAKSDRRTPSLSHSRWSMDWSRWTFRRWLRVTVRPGPQYDRALRHLASQGKRTALSRQSTQGRSAGHVVHVRFPSHEKPHPDSGEVDVLIESRCLAGNPHMRGSMIDGKLFVPLLQIGGMLTGGARGGRLGRTIRASQRTNTAVPSAVSVPSWWLRGSP